MPESPSRRSRDDDGVHRLWTLQVTALAHDRPDAQVGEVVGRCAGIYQRVHPHMAFGNDLHAGTDRVV